jgi:nitronate monooxygenase
MARWPTALTDLLGIEHPIIQAPMAGSSTLELAVAVAGAGGLGSLAAAMLPPARLREEVSALRAATNRPFNVNFFVHQPPSDDPARTARMTARLAPYYAELGIAPPTDLPAPSPPFDDAMLEALLAERPKVVSFHFGLPDADQLQALQAIGTVLLASATTVAEARQLAAAGVDAIIAQGNEAGGHQGSFTPSLPGTGTGTMALVPQVVDAVGCPVIAAGGLMDGRGIAAAFMLGAAGVQLGTAFLGCPEASIHPLHRQALQAASDDGTRMTRAFSGRAARGLTNRLIRELAPEAAGAAGGSGDDILDFPLQRGLTGPLGQAAARQGSADFMPMWAGQGAALARELPAAELVRRLVAETERALTGG